MNLTNKNLLRKGEKKQTYNKVIPCRKKMILCSSIEDRPESINNRENYGHWEMDTVIGKAEGKGQVLLVLTERKSNMEIIKKINGKTEAHVDKALDRLERTYGARFKKIFKTITIDNGSEFLCSEGIEKSCLTKGKRTKIYYCHPYCSWERGSNENANGIIRRFIPKGSPMENYSHKEIKLIENWINNYPRKIHGYYCSSKLFDNFLKTI